MLVASSVDAMVRRALSESARVKRRMADAGIASIVRAAELVLHAIEGGHKVLFLGNGGSAADAQHLAAELVGRFTRDRRPLPGLALTVDTSALTAIGNDYGFEHVFARQLEALGSPGDVVVAITTSGASPNVLAALKVARAKGIAVVGLTGRRGEAFAKLCDAAVVVPSRDVSRVQEAHVTVGHVLCEVVDGALKQAASPAMAEQGELVSRSPKEVLLPTLLALRPAWRDAGLTVVWTHGMFDVLHLGHLELLRTAHTHGDVLVVGVGADTAVSRATGTDPSVCPVGDRVEMLAALELVDHVLVLEDPTPERVLSLVQPDVLCEGAPRNGAQLPERRMVEGYGGRVVVVPRVPDRSTTRLLGQSE